MRRWIGLAGILIILVAAALIRFPEEISGGIVYTGLVATERVSSYPVYAKVVGPENDTIGIALQDYELDFGVLPQGVVARRTIDLGNDGSPVKVGLWSEGNISGILSFSKQDFILDGPESVEIIINATEQGSFSGTMFVSSRIYNYRWLDWLNPVL
jgi:hypothetical protein